MATSPTPEQLRLGRLFHLCYSRSHRAINRAIRHLDIRLRHVWILSAAMEHQPSAQSDLARILDLNENVIVRLVDSLESQGYVRREVGSSDARFREIKVTAAGEQLYRKANHAMGDTYRKLLEPLTDAERDALCRLLQKFLSAN